MSNIPMTHKRFEDIIASYGADEKFWPADEVASMKGLLTSAPALQSILDKAGHLDQLLALSTPTSDVSEALMDRLMAIPGEHQQTSGQSSEATFGVFALLMEVFQVKTRMALAPRIAGLATAAVLGIMVGTTNVALFDQGTHIVDASQLMMSDSGLMRDLNELN